MPAKISRKQQEILDYLKEEILSKGYPPTVREICEKVGLRSTSSVHSHLNTLERTRSRETAIFEETLPSPARSRSATTVSRWSGRKWLLFRSSET